MINGVEIYKLKAKDSVINVVPSCMGNVSKDFSADNMKKTGLYRYFYNQSIMIVLILILFWIFINI